VAGWRIGVTSAAWRNNGNQWRGEKQHGNRRKRISLSQLNSS